MEFETVIGLEIHSELSTKTKIFCPCKVTYGKAPNTFCCPVCMGLPGALPVLNKKVAEYAAVLGQALNCKVCNESSHARKNYFYPDLPKGYQISQGDSPICKDGYLDVNGKNIRINRIHIEEDAGKLIHEGGATKIDFNRAGVPLVEIVTEPDLRSSSEARAFLEKIREILLYLGISECKMQEGNLRCDVNVSVREKGCDEYSERCEMKNVNSFSAVVKAIEYEEKRQRMIIKHGDKVKRETRRWVDEKGESIILRDKESLADYRYFTEPDLPLLKINPDNLNIMPELPDAKRMRYKEEYGFSEYEANEIVKSKRFTELLEEGVRAGGNPKKLYNWLVSHVARILNELEEEIPFSGEELAELTRLIDEGYISSTAGGEVLEIMFKEKKSPKEIVKEKDFKQISDLGELEQIVVKVLNDNPKSVADYMKGKKNARTYLMGQCMRLAENRGNPKILNEILERKLNK